jgi:hypothetical protein
MLNLWGWVCQGGDGKIHPLPLPFIKGRERYEILNKFKAKNEKN